MTSRADIEEILGQRTLALVGASARGRKFGNVVLAELRAKAYEVLPVHPRASSVDGVPCHASIADLPDRVGALVIVVPPARAEEVVREAAEAGIRRIWMQQGAESDAALRTCREQGLTVVHGECILMFAEPVRSVHRVHRWLWRLLGRLPA